MFISRTIVGVGLLLLAIDSFAQQDSFLLVSSRGTNSVRLGYFTPAQPVQGPVDLYWAGNGDLMVVDWNNGRVNAHDGETGAFKRIFIQGMVNTEGITMGPDGRFYAADWSANEIKTYSALTGQGGAVFIGGDDNLVNPNALIFGPQEAVTSTSQEVPDAFRFHVRPNFPNPFQAHTTIPFFAEHARPILLKAFDLQGRLVTSMSTKAAAGAAEVEMDASSLTSGRYAYSLELDGQVRNGLMIKR